MAICLAPLCRKAGREAASNRLRPGRPLTAGPAGLHLALHRGDGVEQVPEDGCCGSGKP